MTKVDLFAMMDLSKDGGNAVRNKTTRETGYEERKIRKMHPMREDIEYEYGYIKTRLTKEALAGRGERSMWRYKELLPVEESTAPTPLRVGWSPLYEESRLAEQLGLKRLWVKDDGQNPVPAPWRSQKPWKPERM